MTLKDLIDVSEVSLIISERGYSNPFLTLRELDCYSSEEFEDVLTPEMLSRKIDTIRAENGYIFVNLEEVER